MQAQLGTRLVLTVQSVCASASLMAPASLCAIAAPPQRFLENALSAQMWGWPFGLLQMAQPHSAACRPSWMYLSVAKKAVVVCCSLSADRLPPRGRHGARPPKFFGATSRWVPAAPCCSGMQGRVRLVISHAPVRPKSVSNARSRPRRPVGCGGRSSAHSRLAFSLAFGWLKRPQNSV